MDDMPQRFPATLPALRAAALHAGFTMSSEERTGNLLAVLAAAQPGGRLLELGTGVGAGTAWLLSGMDPASSLISVELDIALQDVARAELGSDPRVTFVAADGGSWLDMYDGEPFDLVFADTWPRKVHASQRGVESRSRGRHISSRRPSPAAGVAGRSRRLRRAPDR